MSCCKHMLQIVSYFHFKNTVIATDFKVRNFETNHIISIHRLSICLHDLPTASINSCTGPSNSVHEPCNVCLKVLMPYFLQRSLELCRYWGSVGRAKLRCWRISLACSIGWRSGHSMCWIVTLPSTRLKYWLYEVDHHRPWR